MGQLRKLHEEYKELRRELFGDCRIAISDNDPKWKRYDQLLGLFRPQFRTKGWVDPSDGQAMVVVQIKNSNDFEVAG